MYLLPKNRMRSDSDSSDQCGSDFWGQYSQSAKEIVLDETSRNYRLV